MAEFRLSSAAQHDLDGIFDYTVRQWGLVQAVQYTQKIEAALTELAARPERGQDCSLIRAGYRRYTVQRHQIYYRVTGYGIAVIRLLHDRMDAPQHL